jgi:hypothetical protein
MGKINDLQVYVGKNWSGLTTDNHLGAIFKEQPYLASSIVSRLHSEYDHLNLDGLISRLGAEEEHPDDRDFTWMLQGDDEIAIPVISYTAADANKPGVAYSIIKN